MTRMRITRTCELREILDIVFAVKTGWRFIYSLLEKPRSGGGRDWRDANDQGLVETRCLEFNPWRTPLVDTLALKKVK